MLLLLLLLLLLSHFSRVRLCATPYTAAHQAPLSMGFSRQEHWSGVPLPSLSHMYKPWENISTQCVRAKSFQSCLTVAPQAPLSMGFSRQEYCSGLPCPALGHLPSPRIEPTSLMSPALSGGFLTTTVPWEIQGSSYKILCTYLNSLTCTLKIGFIVLNYFSKNKQKKYTEISI